MIDRSAHPSVRQIKPVSERPFIATAHVGSEIRLGASLRQTNAHTRTHIHRQWCPPGPLQWRPAPPAPAPPPPRGRWTPPVSVMRDVDQTTPDHEMFALIGLQSPIINMRRMGSVCTRASGIVHSVRGASIRLSKAIDRARSRSSSSSSLRASSAVPAMGAKKSSSAQSSSVTSVGRSYAFVYMFGGVWVLGLWFSFSYKG